MTENVLLGIVSIAGLLLTSVVGFVLGRRAERQKQTMIVRSEMLTPVEEWLKGAERISGILADTLTSVTAGSRGPISYDFEERKKSYRAMSEATNQVFGIFESNGLRTLRTWRKANRLKTVISELDGMLKYRMLPAESEILDRARMNQLTDDFELSIGAMKLRVDELLQEGYKLISQIRTALT